MRSTSCRQIAEQVLAKCLAGTPPKSLPASLFQEPCTQALFGIVVEGLADRFDPALSRMYVRLFAEALASIDREWDALALLTRYERVRRPRPVSVKPQRVFVLSRVTLGADVAITSVLLAAAKRRFPHAEIVFAGPHKNYELFAADRHIHHAPLDYFRGNLRSRVAAGLELRQLVEASAVAAGLTIVIDPDTRLTQLGLLPVCPEEHYYFFESRSYGAETDYSLPELAGQWAAEILAAKGVKPVLALGRRARKLAGISVSLGVGDNPAKRLADPFEIGLLKLLEKTGMPLVIDAGVGGAEADRVKRAVEASGVKATVWEGSFAGFARIIASSRLYVGYDSAGQHVAAAYGVPMVSIFAGFASQRMFDRWRPRGELCHVIRVEKPDVAETLERVREAVITAAAATA